MRRRLLDQLRHRGKGRRELPWSHVRQGRGRGQYQRCDEVQQNMTGKYVPVQRPKAAHCDPDVMKEWTYDYGYRAPEDFEYRDTHFNAEPECSDSCLDFFRQTVRRAPACLDIYKSYTFQEYQKLELVNCLNLRGDSLDDPVLLLDDAVDAHTDTSSAASPRSAAMVYAALCLFATIIQTRS